MAPFIRHSGGSTDRLYPNIDSNIGPRIGSMADCTRSLRSERPMDHVLSVSMSLNIRYRQLAIIIVIIILVTRLLFGVTSSIMGTLKAAITISGLGPY